MLKILIPQPECNLLTPSFTLVSYLKNLFSFLNSTIDLTLIIGVAHAFIILWNMLSCRIITVNNYYGANYYWLFGSFQSNKHLSGMWRGFMLHKQDWEILCLPIFKYWVSTCQCYWNFSKLMAWEVVLLPLFCPGDFFFQEHIPLENNSAYRTT